MLYGYPKSQADVYDESNRLSAIVNSPGTNSSLPKGCSYVKEEEIMENNNLQTHKQRSNRILEEVN